MNTQKLLLYSVLFYIVWVFFFRSCTADVEQLQKYTNFHQQNFIRLCENNYENLALDAKLECDKYFEARATEQTQEKRKKVQEELSYESRL